MSTSFDWTVGSVTSASLPKGTRAENDWIDEIDNPRHKLLARVQASELAAANRMLREFVTPGTRIEVRDYHNDTNDDDRALNNLERLALEYLFSEQFLAKWQFSVSESGEIVDDNDNVDLKAATVDAVEKALKYLWNHHGSRRHNTGRLRRITARAGQPLA